MMIDGTCFEDQDIIVAIGLTLQGHKVVLGLRQGASENAAVVKQLLRDIEQHGVAFDVPRLYVLDGNKGLSAAVRKVGKCAVIQRCQVHKRGNVVSHLTEEYQTMIRSKLRNADTIREYDAAQRVLGQILRELVDLNPSAAHSSEEGMEETLAVHRLRLPWRLRRTLSSTNLIESTFSMVETVCRNVKRWRGGDQSLVSTEKRTSNLQPSRLTGHRFQTVSPPRK